jgi:hypothetical protein
MAAAALTQRIGQTQMRGVPQQVLIAVALVLPAAAACQPAGRVPGSPQRVTAAPGFSAACASSAPPDVLLLIAGASPFNAQLYWADPCRWSDAPKRAVPDSRISAVSVDGTSVAVTAAPRSVDQVFFLQHGRLRPVGQTGTAPAGRSAAAGPNGAVIFVATDSDTRRPYVLMIATTSRPPAVVYRSRNPLNLVAFARAVGQYVVAEDPTIPGSRDSSLQPFLTVVPEGRQLRSSLKHIYGLVFMGRSNTVAISGRSDEVGWRLSLSDPNRSRLPAGWRVNAVDKREEFLLLDKGGRLGVLPTTDSRGAPIILPTLPVGPMWGGAWVERAFAGAIR